MTDTNHATDEKVSDEFVAMVSLSELLAQTAVKETKVPPIGIGALLLATEVLVKMVGMSIEDLEQFRAVIRRDLEILTIVPKTKLN